MCTSLDGPNARRSPVNRHGRPRRKHTRSAVLEQGASARCHRDRHSGSEDLDMNAGDLDSESRPYDSRLPSIWTRR